MGPFEIPRGIRRRREAARCLAAQGRLRAAQRAFESSLGALRLAAQDALEGQALARRALQGVRTRTAPVILPE